MAIGLLGITLLSLFVASAHDDQPRQAGAHTHGLGEAFILLEGDSLFVQISAPAANFRTPEGEMLTVADLATFDMTETFLSLPNRASCTFTSQAVEEESHEGETEEAHSHDHAQSDAHHHDHDEAPMAEHSNFLVTFEAECDHANRLNEVHFSVFESLPGFERLQTTFMTDNGADATTLSASSPTMSRP